MKTFRTPLLFVLVWLFAMTEAGAQTGLNVSAGSNLNESENPRNTADFPAHEPTPGKKDTPASRRQNKTIVVTGVRFAYPLIQKWIDDYNKTNPDVQIIIESRGTQDPAQYDILVEAYEPDAEAKKNRDYIYMGRYAILPVANNQSVFSKVYGSKGLTREIIKQIFFHDIFFDKSEQAAIKAPYTVYTRLQKAGAPITFSKHFGYQQKDIRGKSIAGSDEHLLKAILRDSTGLTYAPMNLIYDTQSGKPHTGLTILPVDFNGNGKISDDEKFYEHLSTLIERLEGKSQRDINNIPIEYLNLSSDKSGSSPEAILFLKWIIQNGENDLHAFGFLKSDQVKRNE